MKKLPLPTQEYLANVLNYDPETGLLTWKVRPESRASWNGKYAGKVAGFPKTYIMIKLDGKGYVAHRIIWKMVYGDEPDSIDHINRDKHDNRIANLRNVSHSVNMRNKPIRGDAKGKHKYVWFNHRTAKWVVQMMVPNKGQRQLAWEDTIEAALSKRDDFLISNGYVLETDAA